MKNEIPQAKKDKIVKLFYEGKRIPEICEIVNVSESSVGLCNPKHKILRKRYRTNLGHDKEQIILEKFIENYESGAPAVYDNSTFVRILYQMYLSNNKLMKHKNLYRRTAAPKQRIVKHLNTLVDKELIERIEEPSFDAKFKFKLTEEGLEFSKYLFQDLPKPYNI